MNLTDDILLFSQAALADPHPPTRPAAASPARCSTDACSWREVRVEAIDDERAARRVSTVVVGRGAGREFLGFNRARHAVLEASILASRAHLLARREIRAELDRLQVLVDKTAGPREREAMDYVQGARASCECGEPHGIPRSDGLVTVRVEAPARLHLGMLAAAGDGPRRFGGLGVAVSRPAVVLEAERADELSAEGVDAERALMFARRCQEALGLASGAHLRVVEAIPQHVGLGSGTKLALAVAQALAVLGARELDAPALARAAGRAARSAVGMWTFALGGLVVEGGVRRDPKRPAPLLARYEMPEEWRCVLVVPAAEPGLSGAAEDEAFARLAPDARAFGRDRATRADVAAAGARRTRRRGVRSRAHPRPATGRRRPSRRSRAVASIRARTVSSTALSAAGAAGAGQSSWGRPSTASSAARRRRASSRGRIGRRAGPSRSWRFDNAGARVEGGA